jgi:hypothetical protein
MKQKVLSYQEGISIKDQVEGKSILELSGMPII